MNDTQPVSGPIYNEDNVPGPEFRVRPVVRYVVTRYCHGYVSRDGTHGSSGHSEVIAEMPNEQRAFEVAQAMARAENGLSGATVSI